jgi:energy-coupling factor transporter ATP-binding protein EcfA2
LKLPKIIGICGKAGHGKTTLGNMLAGHLRPKHDVSIVPFAEPLKNIVTNVLGVDAAALKDPLLKEVPVEPWGMSPRRLLQIIGTDMFRKHLCSDVWIKVAGERVKRAHDAGRLVIIDDVRFDNEAEWVRSNGGMVLRVSRDASVGTNHTEHVSESGVSKSLIDVEVDNNGMLEELDHMALLLASPWDERKVTR